MLSRKKPYETHRSPATFWSKSLSVGILLIVALAIVPIANANGLAIKKASAKDPLVQTPFGLLPRSCVVFVGDNAALLPSVNGIGDTVRMSNGNVINLSPCPQSLRTSHEVQGSSRPSPCPNGACDTSWAEYATWCYCPRIPPAIFYLDGYWHVPQAPTTNHGQLIYLFTALEPNGGGTSYPLDQPVLQWGVGSDGGGPYWTINSWILTSHTNVLYGTIQNVNPGDTIYGSIDSSGCNPDACDWQVGASDTTTGYGNSVFCGNPTGRPECHVAMYDASVTLEVFGIQNCSDYPASSTTFYSMQMANTQFFQYLTPAWGLTVNNDGCGESITNVSPGSVTLNTVAPLSCSASANPTSGTKVVTVQFSASCSGGVAPYNYNWQFNDGNGGSSSQNPSHTYAFSTDVSPSIYYPTLSVTDNGGFTSQPGVPTIYVYCSGFCPH